MKRIRWDSNGTAFVGRFTLTLRHNASGSWTVQINLCGQSVFYKTRDTPRAAKDACRDRLKRLCEACRELEGE